MTNHTDTSEWAYRYPTPDALRTGIKDMRNGVDRDSKEERQVIARVIRKQRAKIAKLEDNMFRLACYYPTFGKGDNLFS